MVVSDSAACCFFTRRSRIPHVELVFEKHTDQIEKKRSSTQRKKTGADF